MRCPPGACRCGFWCDEMAVCRCPRGCACEPETFSLHGKPARVCEHHVRVCRFRDDEFPVLMPWRQRAPQAPKRRPRRLPGWVGHRGLWARR